MPCPAKPLNWDLFCRVVDNYGDAAVTWRLARQLAGEHGGEVRLFIDQPEVLAALRPGLLGGTSGGAGRVEVLPMARAGDVSRPADVVVEAFGCGLPDAYMAALAARTPAPVWIVLEYLSAEGWVAQHHGLPSPHPSLGLPRWFYFPGFTRDTGGLLREQGLLQARDAHRADADARTAFWSARGFGPVPAGAHCVSLFGYENAALPSLLGAWRDGPEPMVAAVPAGRIRAGVCAAMGMADPGEGAAVAVTQGMLELRFMPFMAQDDYDRLLWSCDWNFVRGEDSLVRALWAGVPLAWQIYPQAERSHMPKLEAFLDGWLDGLGAAPAAAMRDFMRVWNGEGQQAGAAWRALAPWQDALAAHARATAGRLAGQPELATGLAEFCVQRVK
jgi:uncharacterized repeat protein (TIGR03837 family)